MSRLKIAIPKEIIEKFYKDKNLSLNKIALRYSCSPRTIANRIKEFEIPVKSGSQSRTRYKKFDFDGDDNKKAYLIGFRLGDLNVYIPSHKGSETIVIRCHSTINEQIQLVKKLFIKYGKITISKSKNKQDIHINCFLNKSFNFLLPKYNNDIRRWLNKSLTMPCFIAGYTDAEGSFGINQGKGRFKIDSYDFKILKDINNFLNKMNISTKFRLIAKKGDRRNYGKWNNNLWRLNINKVYSLENFTKLIFPFMKHQNRINDAKIVLENIKQRRKNGTVK